ncbi:hypothetical protein E2562_023933 [Oryza meyeriana var. granulata]|uniref:MsrB domain-containing protein n=1 Tax=Oryza meyeriana var. granulata TaxID=110450 RepID=A0A6G1C090_9ORYZ|nr:hypothetical protein E2562_023933 [Oryza meyeriana var. granulata]
MAQQPRLGFDLRVLTIRYTHRTEEPSHGRSKNFQSNAASGAVSSLEIIPKLDKLNKSSPKPLRKSIAATTQKISLYPEGVYFEAGNKGTLSFSWVDESRLRFAAEDKIRPFFETLNYWGIQRKRTRISCDACGRLLGYVYDDGPPVMQGTGQFGMGPSQVIPRRPRYRIKTKAVTVANPPAAAPYR